MTIYALLNRLFPKSFVAKIFFVSFIGTHVPLIAMVGYFLGSGVETEQALSTLVVILGATLVGTGFSFVTIWMLLAPVRLTRRSLTQMEGGMTAPYLPEHYRDDLGFLMSRTNAVARSIGRRLAVAEEAALVDPLTRVLNRRGMVETVPHVPDGALLFLDIDKFKSINDAHGHKAGDAVLKQVADVVSRALRQGDVLARVGGEEFVVWLPRIARPEAEAAAERIRRSIPQEVLAGAPVTASIGLAICDGQRTLDAMLDLADGALYEAKAKGRNRVCLAAGSHSGRTPSALDVAAFGS